MTDTPPNATFPPVPLIERVKSLIGDLARPFVLYAVGTATAVSIVSRGDAGVIAAAGAILCVIYGAKSLEQASTAKAGASVEIAKVNAGAPV